MAPVQNLTDRATGGAARRAARPVILLTLALALTACGGGSNEAGSGAGAVGTPPPGGSAPPSTPPPGSTNPPPPIQPPPDSTLAPAIAPIGAALPEPLPDSDYDGIPDHLDAFPFEAPLFTTPGSASWMRVEGAWTEIEGRAVPDAVVAGHQLMLSGRGLGAGGGGEWAVFDTRRGKVAVRPQIVSPGTWKVAAPPLALSVHAVVGNQRSESRLLSYVEPGAPVLFPPTGRVLAGTPLRLEGLNLEGVDVVTLGSALLSVEASGPDFVRVTLPASSDGNELKALAGGLGSNPVSFDYRRRVMVSIDPALPLRPDDVLQLNLREGVVRLQPGNAVSLEVPAHRPGWYAFDLLRAAGGPSYGILGFAAWPDERVVQVSLDATIGAELLKLWPMLASGGDADWREQRDRVRGGLALHEAAAFRDALAEHLRSGSAFARYELRSRLLAAVDRAALEAAEILADGPSLGGGRSLDDLLVGVVGLSSGDAPDTPRATYSQFTVQRATDCVTLGLPVGTSPSDVCVENGTVLPASIAVYVPQRFIGGSRYTPTAADRRRAHISGPTDKNSLRDDKTILSADDKQSLCGMRPCFVEILTPGAGEGAGNIVLTAAEQQILNNLRLRWVLDAFVVPMARDLAGLSAAPENAVCLFDAFVQDQVGLGAAVSSFYIGAFQNPSGAIDIFENTMGKYLVDTITETANITTADKVLDCALGELPGLEDVRDRIGQNLGSARRLLNRVLLFVDVVETTMRFGGVLFTPPKMLFRVEPRAEITGFSPSVLDLNDIYASDGSDRVFKISGDWLANSTVPPTFVPTLYFRDKRGASRDFSVLPTQVVEGVDPQRELLFSLPRLAFFNPDLPSPLASLSGLEPGQLEMWLEYSDEYSDPGFNNYPDGVLKVPSALSIQLVTPPRITTFDPPSARPGQQVLASGSGLERYAARPRVVLLSNTVVREEWSGGPIPAEIRDGKLLFTLPACSSDTGCVPRGDWLVQLNDGTGSLAQVVVSDRAFSTGPGTVFPVIKLGDFSSTDDRMFMQLQDINETVLQERVLPDVIGDRFVSLVVNDPSNLRYVAVECVDAGADSTCTYDLTGEDVAYLVGTDFEGGTGGQIPEGTSVVFPVCVPGSFADWCDGFIW
ncbi:hypothetical protein [Thioalkalivibrio sp. XN279]|uniref:hypothetical protein n=1 Tax=Thioalkalivibrio sp. XN279 TaxID=2714953 RepID=UPI00140D1179|nr:hypothetical protein [Thioalkalivibrio sp. XN279]NHA13553.1 hypothetical protein [Thioalkalivibrio sp. XN279]